ncbi:hypothetical protein VB151_00990 [Xanthomonas fragariae]|uniref:Uncharacterized protein n=1 Tax=Xanthomonas fragariae TaxID=48664 RepID=A0A1Y6H1Z0_9XANT|nr:hypothetical protein [Xanthomonas fragariae]AOD16249.1 hypothetical protein BER92_18200 [Xanthomonas fragariae]AOD19680.1 hypothetical protein BER93_18255 [Xanthomonas fragariae]ENZ95522.1 hypothetical protein O1K_10497 [Xanthomonas fragariae LMG 25863]MBL9197079.1 hypothetical protein [Xanthomonas fragariae]MBL9222030.1 hypothetical protein [Xanthomonas fragariae]
MSVPYQIPGRAPDESRNQNVSNYWRERFTEEPYYTDGDRYEDYEPAYLAGHEARMREVALAYDQIEADLHKDWETNRGSSSLSWSKARHAVRRAWENAPDFVTGDEKSRP